MHHRIHRILLNQSSNIMEHVLLVMADPIAVVTHRAVRYIAYCIASIHSYISHVILCLSNCGSRRQLSSSIKRFRVDHLTKGVEKSQSCIRWRLGIPVTWGLHVLPSFGLEVKTTTWPTTFSIESFRLYNSILSTYVRPYISDGVFYLWVGILYEHIEGRQPHTSLSIFWNTGTELSKSRFSQAITISDQWSDLPKLEDIYEYSKAANMTESTAKCLCYRGYKAVAWCFGYHPGRFSARGNHGSRREW
jgi:hypothetical protein